ncbi:hypothetical protein [Paenibacillus taichungensis]|uniref:hypothetical protein n=1 Tax=Paenibacillus taichungensis TaxID=484184 RepID=UPI0035D5EBCC
MVAIAFGSAPLKHQDAHGFASFAKVAIAFGSAPPKHQDAHGFASFAMVAIAFGSAPLKHRDAHGFASLAMVAIAFGPAPEYTTSKCFPINLLTNFNFSISIDLILGFQHV